MVIECILLIGWILIGALNLCSERAITKWSYFAVWSIVVLYSILNLVS